MHRITCLQRCLQVKLYFLNISVYFYIPNNEALNLDCTVHVDFLCNVVKIRTVAVSSCLVGRDYHVGNLSNTFASNVSCNIALNGAEHCNKNEEVIHICVNIADSLCFVCCVVAKFFFFSLTDFWQLHFSKRDTQKIITCQVFIMEIIRIIKYVFFFSIICTLRYNHASSTTVPLPWVL